MCSRCPLKFNFNGSVEGSKLLPDLVSMVGRLDLPDMVVNGERVDLVDTGKIVRSLWQFLINCHLHILEFCNNRTGV